MSVLREIHLHVVGLGLMGASLAMALKGKVACLSGSDANPQVAQRALADGVVQTLGGLEEADCVILAIPADAILHVAPRLAYKNGAVVIDLGSTKGQICAVLGTLAPQVASVGGHPMCGVAENGYNNAFPSLYANARFILCETEGTTPHALQLAEALVAALGALPLWMDAAEHDRLAGAISHLPHLMSFALMRLAMELADKGERVYDMAAGGFDGATRLARTDQTMITGMFTTNPTHIRALVELLQVHLAYLTSLLDTPHALRQELDSIVKARREYTERYGERLIT
jgi:prephenate dehydrogenase